MKSLYIIAPVAASGFVVVAVVIALWMAGSASSERARFSSLEVAPRDVDVIFAVNTDPTSPQWLAVNDSLEAINAKDPLRQAVDEALAEFDLEWERDIIPVAGDEAFFAVPDVAAVEDGSGFIGGFLIRDEGKAQELIDSLRERAEREGEEFAEEEYEGVTIVYVVPPGIDGDPSTESDCEVDEEGTILCDGEAPIPENPQWKCAQIAFDLTDEGQSTTEAPEECRPFLDCPFYLGPQDQATPVDADGDGQIDACAEADRIMREWEESIELAGPYQDCADLEDISDDQCDEVPPVVVAQAAGVGGAVALVENVLAVGGTPDDVKAVIDVAQDRAPSAQSNERLQEFRVTQKEDFLMWGYADLEPVWDMAESALPADLGTDSDSGEIHLDSEPVTTPSPTEPATPDTGFTIPSFDADYRIQNGALLVTERITVDFGQTPRSGFNRDIATRFMYDIFYDMIVAIEPLSVTKDGAPETFSQLPVAGDYDRLEIGDPAVTITGQHTYEIQYAVYGALVNIETEDGDPSYDIVWNVTGNNWGVPIQQATATLTIPGESFLYTPCSVGTEPFPATQIGCTSTQDGITTMRFAANGPIEPGSGMSFMAGVFGESGAPDVALVPRAEFSDQFPLEDQEPEDTFSSPFDSQEIIDELRGAFDRVGFSISSTSDGFAFDLTVLEAPDYEPDESTEAFQSFDPRLAELLPADTMFYFSAFDIYNAAKKADTGLGDIRADDDESATDFFDEFRRETGIDLEDDFLTLLTGEFAFAGNVANFDAEIPDFELVALTGVSDGDKMAETLEELGDYLEDQGLISTRSDDLGWEWRFVDSPDIEPVGWAVRDGRLIVGYPDTAAKEAGAQDDSLADNRDWKRTLDLLPDDKIFVGFVSVARVLEEVRKTEGADEEFGESTDGKLSLEDLEAIRSVGFSANTEEDGFSFHAVLFVEDN